MIKKNFPDMKQILVTQYLLTQPLQLATINQVIIAEKSGQNI